MENLHPLVTIVLPVHNGQRFLASSIESCLRQTYTNFELIVVDDCSTDLTAHIIDRYLQRDQRIRAVRNTQNLKLPQSLNKGFSLSHGHYLTWTSDDNLFTDDALEKMLEALHNNPDVGLVYANQLIIDDEGHVVGRFDAQKPEQVLYRNPVNACFMYRRAVYEAVGNYDDQLFLVEDWDYWIRISKLFKMMRLDQDLYYYRQHSNSLSARRRAEADAAIYRLKSREAVSFRAPNEVRARYLAHVAHFGFWIGMCGSARRQALSAVRIAPILVLREERMVIAQLFFGRRFAQWLRSRLGVRPS